MGKQSVDEIWASLKSSTMKKASDARSGVRNAMAESPSGATAEAKAGTGGATATSAAEPAQERSLAELPDLSAEVVVAALRRDVNCLTDENRATRRGGAERLRRRLLEDADFLAKGGRDLLPSVLTDSFLAPLARLLNDPAEKCREAGVLFVRAAASALQDTSLLFQRTVPAVKARIGGDEACEPSEELRLWMVQLLRGDLATRCAKDHLVAYAPDIISVVVRGLDDPFHEVKKETCRLICDLPTLVGSRGALLEHAETIVKGVVRNMAHPHYKVRVLLVSAVDAVVGMRPSREVVDKLVATILHEATFDKARQVRGRVYECMASWLAIVEEEEKVPLEAGAEVGAGVRAPEPLYAEILLPFYLVGMLDEEREIREVSRQRLEEVCARNAEAGCYPAGPHEDGGEGGNLVRRMVRHHLKHIAIVCKRDSAEWTKNKNLSAARLLRVATEIAGRDMDPYLGSIVPLLCNAIGNENEDIAQHIVRCTHHIGAACDPESWACTLLDTLNNPKSSIPNRANALVVLAGLVHGCSQTGREMGADTLAALASTLASEEIRGAGHYAINNQLLSVITNVLEAFGGGCGPVSRDLYHVLLQLQALRDDDALRSGAVLVTQRLAEACGYESAASFASGHSEDLLRVLCGTCAEWTKDSPDQFVFAALVFNCSAEVLARLYDQVTQVFCSCLSQERDPHVRLETLKVVDRLLEDQDRNGFIRPSSMRFLAEVLLPPAVWQAGKTAASIRFHAIVAIGTFFREDLMSPTELVQVLIDDRYQLLPTIHSSLEEDYYADTRLCSCHTLAALLNCIGTKLTNDQKRLVYPELVKRLDDSSDKVRIQACATLEAFVGCLEPDYCETNTGYILKGILIHMDDTNPEVQEAVCLVVEKLAKVKPGVTRGSLHEVREQHRGVAFIDRVLGSM